jgi:UDP-glucose 4-epimerase
MRKNNVKKIVFTSTSAVYGRQKKFPIKEEDVGKMMPISNYAASKLASEIYIHSFSNLYGIEGLVLRMANVIGPRSNHGIVPDLVRKIKNNPKKLEVLGNGMQKKSYIHISDCIDAILLASKKFKKFDIFNIGYSEWISVSDIVSLVCREMNVKPEIFYTGSEIGWPGDVPEFLLDNSKIKSLGWKPKMTTNDAIISAVNWAKKEKNL